MMTGGKFEASASRRDSRKRRRLSERRRVFGRIGLAEQQLIAGGGSLSSSERTWSQQSSVSQFPAATATAGLNAELEQQFPIRADSPLSDNSKISMKIQFHITVAPDNEPLILDTSQLSFGGHSSPWSSAEALADQGKQQQSSIESSSSIGDRIHERLSRQNTLSTRRRQHLLALHNQPALESSSNNNNSINADESNQHLSNSMPEQLGASPTNCFASERDNASAQLGAGNREAGQRSSTITGGMADEATVRFLARHRQATISARPSQGSLISTQGIAREHIYFKRDGQRFGHEFTLKLSIDKTYRCLIKVRPLIPLQTISVQGHQVLFVDCSQSASGGASSALASAGSGASQSAPSSALASSANLNRSWNNIHNNHNNGNNRHQSSVTNQRLNSISNSSSNYRQQQQQPQQPQPQQHQLHRLNHAETSVNLNKRQLDSQFLYQQQQSQMMRHFAASHCSSSSSAHLGSQLIYMFDWSASRFEVNKNKARTQIQTVLKFKNGQILSLPLQVKFYQPDCKQHLSWGSQLHFIDYDCNINNMGQMSVDRIHYY